MPRLVNRVNPNATFEPAEIVREFIRDIEAVGVAHVQAEWPDLHLTYLRAKQAEGV